LGDQAKVTGPVEKLLSISGEALSAEEPASLRGDGGDGRLIADLLWRRNGFYAFESALHVFGAGGGQVQGRSLEEWNDVGLWKDAYGGLMTDGLFFAEDVFGGQFVSANSLWGIDSFRKDLSFSVAGLSRAT
jgi:hypothetical protein